MQELCWERPVRLRRPCVMVVNEGHCPGGPPPQHTCSCATHAEFQPLQADAAEHFLRPAKLVDLVKDLPAAIFVTTMKATV